MSRKYGGFTLSTESAATTLGGRAVFAEIYAKLVGEED